MFDYSASKEKTRKLIVLSSYPSKGTLHGIGLGGISSYTKNTVKAIASKIEVVVLAEYHEKVKKYYEDSVYIKRVWKKDNLLSYFKIIKEIIKYRKKSNNFLIEFEFGTYGSDIILIFIPIIIFISRILGYQTTIVLHQIVENLKRVSLHLGLRNKLLIIIKEFFLKLFYKVLVRISSKVIVMDKIHQKNLKKIVKNSKTYVIPHGVEHMKKVNKNNYKRKGKFIVMIFGYIAWYKGTDWLIDAFIQNKKRVENNNLQLVIAGGKSPTQSHKEKYLNYYNSNLKKIRKSSNIIHTGFVNEGDIGHYFNTADILIFPYRVLMSSSGPLSLALAYKKPFLLSDELYLYTLTDDFQLVLNQLDIEKSEFIFKFNYSSLLEMLEKYSKDKFKINKLTKLSSELREKRAWKVIGEKYLEVLRI